MAVAMRGITQMPHRRGMFEAFRCCCEFTVALLKALRATSQGEVWVRAGLRGNTAEMTVEGEI